MAVTRYVNPDTGSDSNNGQTSGTAFATVTKAIENIATSAGMNIVILENSLNHTIRVGDLGHGDEVRIRASMTFQNGDDDEDYSKVEIGGTDNVRLNIHVDAVVTIWKGITFKDRTFTDASRAVVRSSGRSNSPITFTGVRWTNIHGSSGTTGPVLDCPSNVTNDLLIMTNCVIDNCSHTNGYRTLLLRDYNIAIDNLTYINNGDEVGTDNGAFIVAVSRAGIDQAVLIRNSTFRDNYSGGDGGNIYFFFNEPDALGSTQTVTVQNSTFTDCHATAKGGGFWIGRDTLGYVKGCTFTRCSSGTYGGGATGKGTSVTQATNQHMEVSGCLFVDCTTDNEGGALKCDDASWIQIDNCTFLNCLAGGNGDTIEVSTRDVTHTSTLTSLNNCIIFGTTDEFHITAGDDSISTITDVIIAGASSAISALNATETRVTNLDSGDVNTDGSLPAGSNAVGVGNKWWGTDPRPTGSNKEPFPDWDIDIGGLQSLFSPYHPSNL